jgi:endonuclease/exonuclease/phosphatase family metal-dependent hydrolase
MSFNIHHANPPAEEVSGKIDIDGIVNAINKVKPDVVALQEVDVNTQRSGKIDEATLIAEKLGMQVFFAKAIDYDDGEYGLAILSKFEMSNHEINRLSLKADAKAELRILQTVILNLPKGKKIKFGNTHLDVLNTGNRELQAEEIVNLAKKENLPFILAGDWNANVGSTTLNILDSVFTRTCTTCPVTCPGDGEQGAIDFIAFAKNHSFKVTNYKVYSQDTSSDHYPISVKLKLR